MRRRTVAPWALSIVIAVAGVPVDRVGSERGIKQIMKCVWNTQQESFTCSMRVYIDEDLPEIVAENERIDITPGGWGVDPNNGTCSDCMTPYPQFEDDPPEEVFDEIDQCGGSQADERDIVRAEYVAIAPGLGWVPSCQDFATTGGTAHFGWNELSLYPGNEHVPLAIVKAGTELENTQVEYGLT